MALLSVIMFLGLPGSGKGTQADILAERFGYFHFDTGKEIEQTVHDSMLQSDPLILNERKLFDTGMLNTPSWVEGLVKNRIHMYAEAGKRLVFSGSPRTLDEAKGLLPVFDSLYGKSNMILLVLTIKDETSIFRNTHRRVCEKCRIPVIWNEETSHWIACPRCGGKLVKRILDVPEVIKDRIEQYRTRTEPVVNYFRDAGIKTVFIDAEAHPEAIADRVSEQLK